MAGRDTDNGLDLFLAAARDAAPEPSAALMARVLADAEALQPSPRPQVEAAPPGRPAHRVYRRQGWPARLWQRLAGGLTAALGGAGAVAGLATAALAGVWIGFAQPLPVATLIVTSGAGTASEAEFDLADLFTDEETLFGAALAAGG